MERALGTGRQKAKSRIATVQGRFHRPAIWHSLEGVASCLDLSRRHSHDADVLPTALTVRVSPGRLRNFRIRPTSYHAA
jgi:hypothetical protein